MGDRLLFYADLSGTVVLYNLVYILIANKVLRELYAELYDD